MLLFQNEMQLIRQYKRDHSICVGTALAVNEVNGVDMIPSSRLKPLLPIYHLMTG